MGRTGTSGKIHSLFKRYRKNFAVTGGEGQSKRDWEASQGRKPDVVHHEVAAWVTHIL